MIEFCNGRCVKYKQGAPWLSSSRPRRTVRKLAFFCDPFGNLIELAEVLP
jgi:hypothetical protein